MDTVTIVTCQHNDAFNMVDQYYLDTFYLLHRVIAITSVCTTRMKNCLHKTKCLGLKPSQLVYNSLLMCILRQKLNCSAIKTIKIRKHIYKCDEKLVNLFVIYRFYIVYTIQDLYYRSLNIGVLYTTVQSTVHRGYISICMIQWTVEFELNIKLTF